MWKKSDNVDYANKIFNIYGEFIIGRSGWGNHASGVFKIIREQDNNSVYEKKEGQGVFSFNYTLNGMPTSFNESRPKTKFFSLMIYAGYPIV